MHPHEELLRREAESAISGDYVVEDFYTEDHVLHYPGNNPLSGDYHGHAGIEEFGRGIAAIVSTQLELHDAMANDDHGVELGRVRGERKDGTRHEWRITWVCHFREGKISESWGQIDDQPALDEFLSG